MAKNPRFFGGIFIEQKGRQKMDNIPVYKRLIDGAMSLKPINGLFTRIEHIIRVAKKNKYNANDVEFAIRSVARSQPKANNRFVNAITESYMWRYRQWLNLRLHQ